MRQGITNGVNNRKDVRHPIWNSNKLCQVIECIKFDILNYALEKMSVSFAVNYTVSFVIFYCSRPNRRWIVISIIAVNYTVSFVIFYCSRPNRRWIVISIMDRQRRISWKIIILNVLVSYLNKLNILCLVFFRFVSFWCNIQINNSCGSRNSS